MTDLIIFGATVSIEGDVRLWQPGQLHPTWTNEANGRRRLPVRGKPSRLAMENLYTHIAQAKRESDILDDETMSKWIAARNYQLVKMKAALPHNTYENDLIHYLVDTMPGGFLELYV